MASSIQILRSNTAKERPFPGNLLDGQPALNTNAEEPGLFFKTSDGSIVKIGPAFISNDGQPPNSNPVGLAGNNKGEIWVDASLEPPVFKVFDGSDWIAVTGTFVTDGSITEAKLADGAVTDAKLAEDGAVATTLSLPYPNRAAAEAASISELIQQISYLEDGSVVSLVSDSNGRDLTTSNGRKWKRIGVDTRVDDISQGTNNLEYLNPLHQWPGSGDSRWGEIFPIAASSSPTNDRLNPGQPVPLGEGWIFPAITSFEWDNVTTPGGSIVGINTGSLFYLDKNLNVQELAGNPILARPKFAWEGARVSVSVVIQDPNTRLWHAYYGCSTLDLRVDGNPLPNPVTDGGIRRIGHAKSNTLLGEGSGLVTWERDSQPFLTVDDVSDWYPDATRIYISSVFYFEGLWYFFVAVSGGSLGSTTGVLVSNSPDEKPKTPTGHINPLPLTVIGVCRGPDGVFYGTETGNQTRIRFSNHLLGPWQISPIVNYTIGPVTQPGEMLWTGKEWIVLAGGYSDPRVPGLKGVVARSNRRAGASLAKIPTPIQLGGTGTNNLSDLRTLVNPSISISTTFDTEEVSTSFRAAVITSTSSKSSANRSIVLASDGTSVESPRSGAIACRNTFVSGLENGITFAAACDNSNVTGNRASAISTVSCSSNGVGSVALASRSGSTQGSFSSIISTGSAGAGCEATASLSVVIAGRRVKNEVTRSIALGEASEGDILTANRTIHLYSDSGNIDISGSLTQGATFSDFAEMFPNATGKEIPLGTIVAEVNGAVCPAAKGDEISGVVTNTAAVTAGDSPFCWSQRYLIDEWGQRIEELVPDQDWEGEGDPPLIKRFVQNPNWDPSLQQIPRSKRPEEWTRVALLGQVFTKVAKDVQPGDKLFAINGIGHKSMTHTGLRCMKITQPFDEEKGYAIARCLINVRV
jgi:hypothetical protein